jgi:MFS family permease
MPDSPSTDVRAPASPVQPAAMLAPGDVDVRIRQTLRLSTVEGAITTVFLNWTSGAVLTGYLIFLGAGPMALAAVASVPLLVQVLNPLLAWVANRQSHRMVFMSAAATVGRSAWLLAALLPLLHVPPAWWPLCLVALVAFSSLFQTAAGLTWVSMMADVVSEQVRGRYFGLRNGICGVVGTVAGLGVGWYLDRAPAPASFQMVMVVAVLCALVGIRLYLQHYEPRSTAERLSLRDTLQVPLRDANFRRFMVFAVYWNASVMLAATFVIPYFFKHLHMTFTQVAMWSAIASLCGLFLGPLWGRVADRVGHKTVLAITTFLAGSVHPLCWMLATPNFLWFVWLSGLMDALSWGGINTAMFNLTLTSAPARHRMAYIAVLGMASGLAGCIAGLLSGPLLELLLRWSWSVGDFTWTGYHSLFLIAGLLRTQAWRLLRPVHEARARPATELLRDVWNRTLDRLPWRL